MKCLCCREIFLPDPRNRHHQKFCKKERCRQASKRASQQRWVAKPENTAHFGGPDQVERVRQWRQANPGYWRKHKRKSASMLQDICPDQAADNQTFMEGDPQDLYRRTLQDVCLDQAADVQSVAEGDPQNLFRRTLQDVCLAQTPLLVGLLSQLVDSALQEDIVGFARRMVAKGQDLLDIPSRRSLNQNLPYDTQKTPPPRTTTKDPTPLQLGRPPAYSSTSAR